MYHVGKYKKKWYCYFGSTVAHLREGEGGLSSWLGSLGLCDFPDGHL